MKEEVINLNDSHEESVIFQSNHLKLYIGMGNRLTLILTKKYFSIITPFFKKT